MIPTALSIDDIAARLGGEVVSGSIVRAPGPDRGDDDRSLMVTKTPAGLIVIPDVGRPDASRLDRKVRQAIEAYVADRIAGGNRRADVLASQRNEAPVICEPTSILEGE